MCCLNCESKEWPLRSRGYCIKCYPIIIDIEKVRTWIEKNRNSIKPIRGVNPSHFNSEKDFEGYKNRLIKELNDRLSRYKSFVNKTHVDGLEVEHCFRRIAKLAIGKDIGRGLADDFNDFTAENRLTLYKSLMEILLEQPYRVNYSYVMDLKPCYGMEK